MAVNDTQVEVTTEAFSPQVLRTALFEGMSIQPGFRFVERNVYDYEMEFFLDSQGSMLINGVEYQINKGDIVFRRPTQTTQGIMPYRCYVIFFDLLGTAGKKPLEYEFERKQNFQTNYRNIFLDMIPTVFHPVESEKYLSLFDAVLQEYINYSEVSSLNLKSLLLQILYQLYIDIRNPLAGGALPSSPHYMDIKRVVEYIEKNYSSQLELSDMAAISELSPNYFHRLFTKAMGVTPNDYLMRIRLEKAKEALAKTSINISEIALSCGFNNIPYFSYVFSSRFDISPRQFRKKHQYLWG
jgi:AraC family transcriptional regulator